MTEKEYSHSFFIKIPHNSLCKSTLTPFPFCAFFTPSSHELINSTLQGFFKQFTPSIKPKNASICGRITVGESQIFYFPSHSSTTSAEPSRVAASQLPVEYTFTIFILYLAPYQINHDILYQRHSRQNLIISVNSPDATPDKNTIQQKTPLFSPATNTAFNTNILTLPQNQCSVKLEIFAFLEALDKFIRSHVI
jgi:hypothetical protein